MRVFSLNVDTRLILNDKEYSVIRMGEHGDCTLQEPATGRMIRRNHDDLLHAWANRELTFLGPTEVASRQTVLKNEPSLANLSQDTQDGLNRRVFYIQTAERRLGLKPVRRELELAIADAAEKIADRQPPSVSTVYRWWVRWRSSNQDINALRNRLSGSRKSSKFCKVAIDVMNEVVESQYLTRQKASLQSAYDAYQHRMLALNQLRTEQINYPSRAQFYRLVQKHNAYEVMKLRDGKRVADEHFRASGKGVDTKHILERVEVDHTPMDVFTYNPETGLSDGRPYLTLMIDHYSRMPLGFVLGFEPPSELSVMRALKNAITPKSYIAKKFPDIKETWRAYGTPITLVCDNGMEFHSNQLKRVCNELNIELFFCPKHEPYYKGTIERFLGSVNRAVSHRLSGTSFSSIQHRGDYDSQKHATVTLERLNELIHEWIIDIYCHDIHRTTKQTPYKRWTDGLANYSPILPVCMTQFELALCKQTTRFLRHTGVELCGLFYNSYALAQLRQILPKGDNRLQVIVCFNPDDLGRIWILDPTDDSYLIVECTDMAYADGLTLLAHEQIKANAKIQADQGHDAATQLERKARFVEKLKQQEVSKKVTTRRKAARHRALTAAHSVPGEAIQSHQKPSFSEISFVDSLPELSMTTRRKTK